MPMTSLALAFGVVFLDPPGLPNSDEGAVPTARTSPLGDFMVSPESSEATTATGGEPDAALSTVEPEATNVDKPARDPGRFRTGRWALGGIVDAAYTFNSNLPNNHVYRGAVTTPRTGEFTIHVVGLSVEHQAPSTGGWTLQLAGHAGAAVDAVYGAEPTPGGDDSQFAGAEVFKHIALANAGFRFRTGTDVGIGVFTGPIGIGGLWSSGNWLYSSSWESNWAPYYLSGIRVQQALPHDFSVEAWLVNGWQHVGDGNAAPSGVVGLTWAPSGDELQGLWVATHWFAGPETQSLAPETWLVHGSLQAGVDRPGFGVAAVVDAGRGGLSDEPNSIGRYCGGAVFSRTRLVQGRRSRLDLNLRPETWWDPDGLTFGRPGLLTAVATGLAWHAFDVLIPRIEYRFDHSTAERGSFFVRGADSEADQLARTQHTLFFNLTAHYELTLRTRA